MLSTVSVGGGEPQKGTVMKHMRKRVLAVVLSLIMAVGMTGCGSGGDKKDSGELRTPELLSGISEKKGIHMDFSIDEGEDDVIDMEMYQKKDDIYVDFKEGGVHVIIISDGETATILDPSTKTGVQSEMDDATEEEIENMTEDMDEILDLDDDDLDWKTGTVKQDGMEYESEEVEKKHATIKFLYNDDGDLAYIISEKENDESVMKINAFDNEIPKDAFDIPDGYDIQGGTSDTTSKKGQDTKTDSNDRMPSPSGKYETYQIRSGYTFEYDTAYSIDEDDDTTRVYTYKKGGVPFFYLWLMQNGSGSTARELLSGVGNQKVKSLGDKLVKGPITNTFDAGDRKIDGIEWIYKSDDGTKEYVGVQYTEVIGTFYFNWCAVYEPGDTETPKALEHAMKTFKMLAT